MSTFYCGDCEPSCHGHSSYEVSNTDFEPDPARFKPPHVWATFVPTRSSSEIFKTHSTAGVAKLAIRASAEYARKKNATMRVYEWDSELGSWAGRAVFPPGTVLEDHEFFKVKHVRKPVQVSQAAVDKAVASILKAGS